MKFTKVQIFLTLVVAILMGAILGVVCAPTEQVEVVKYVEVQTEENFDVSVLENWGGDFSDGKIRMMGAWLYGQDNEGNPIVIDEQNELWTLPNFNIAPNDFLLLWIADNHTVENVQDDIVMKIWVEKYEEIEGVG